MVLPRDQLFLNKNSSARHSAIHCVRCVFFASWMWAPSDVVVFAPCVCRMRAQRGGDRTEVPTEHRRSHQRHSGVLPCGARMYFRRHGCCVVRAHDNMHINPPPPPPAAGRFAGEKEKAVRRENGLVASVGARAMAGKALFCNSAELLSYLRRAVLIHMPPNVRRFSDYEAALVRATEKLALHVLVRDKAGDAFGTVNNTAVKKYALLEGCQR